MLDVQFYRVSVGYEKKHYLVFIALSVAVRYLKNNPMEISFLNCYCIFPYSINEISPFLFLLTITHIFKETVALFWELVLDSVWLKLAKHFVLTGI